jgi:glycerol-1-phosphate dehydrogenase [NAD(P)+]
LNCAVEAEAIGVGKVESIRVLMEGLIESGLCILDFGNSHPASGGEHHLSHFWELKLLREHRPALLHGAKVGVASIITAQLYDRLRRLSRNAAADRLKNARRPRRDLLVKGIQSAYGTAADQIIQEQAGFLDMPEQTFSALKQRILDCWNEVQAIANTVPASEQLAEWLRAAGAPVEGQGLGLSEEEVALAVEYGHYLRNRFTILKLSRMLGL